VFGDANWLHGGDPVYEVSIISPGPERVVQSHLGTALNTDETYRECRGPIDTLLVAGFDFRQEIRFEEDFLNWLRELSGKSRRFGSVCTGAFAWLQLGCSMAGARPLTGTGATISRETTR
jgi:transcriptional regulator GlxA family with amidase domain